MLVLSRKVDQSVVLTCPDGTVIDVMVTRIEPHKVRLGVTAPADVSIVRRELDGRELRVVSQEGGTDGND
ncbi:MAG: carbon storage regulator [Planctomycetes bacterium]|nr:carbon storage regulator [Planctomycetota bacterium]